MISVFRSEDRLRETRREKGEGSWEEGRGEEGRLEEGIKGG